MKLDASSFFLLQHHTRGALDTMMDPSIELIRGDKRKGTRWNPFRRIRNRRKPKLNAKEFALLSELDIETLDHTTVQIAFSSGSGSGSHTSPTVFESDSRDDSQGGFSPKSGFWEQDEHKDEWSNPLAGELSEDACEISVSFTQLDVPTMKRVESSSQESNDSSAQRYVYQTTSMMNQSGKMTMSGGRDELDLLELDEEQGTEVVLFSSNSSFDEADVEYSSSIFDDHDESRNGIFLSFEATGLKDTSTASATADGAQSNFEEYQDRVVEITAVGLGDASVATEAVRQEPVVQVVVLEANSVKEKSQEEGVVQEEQVSLGSDEATSPFDEKPPQSRMELDIMVDSHSSSPPVPQELYMFSLDRASSPLTWISHDKVSEDEDERPVKEISIPSPKEGEPKEILPSPQNLKETLALNRDTIVATIKESMSMELVTAAADAPRSPDGSPPSINRVVKRGVDVPPTNQKSSGSPSHSLGSLNPFITIGAANSSVHVPSKRIPGALKQPSPKGSPKRKQDVSKAVRDPPSATSSPFSGFTNRLSGAWNQFLDPPTTIKKPEVTPSRKAGAPSPISNAHRTNTSSSGSSQSHTSQTLNLFSDAPSTISISKDSPGPRMDTSNLFSDPFDYSNKFSSLPRSTRRISSEQLPRPQPRGRDKSRSPASSKSSFNEPPLLARTILFPRTSPSIGSDKMPTSLSTNGNSKLSASPNSTHFPKTTPLAGAEIPSPSHSAPLATAFGQDTFTNDIDYEEFTIKKFEKAEPATVPWPMPVVSSVATKYTMRGRLDTDDSPNKSSVGTPPKGRRALSPSRAIDDCEGANKPSPDRSNVKRRRARRSPFRTQLSKSTSRETSAGAPTTPGTHATSFGASYSTSVDGVGCGMFEDDSTTAPSESESRFYDGEEEVVFEDHSIFPEGEFINDLSTELLFAFEELAREGSAAMSDLMNGKGK